MTDSESFWDTVINTTPHDMVFYKDDKVFKSIPPSKEHQLRMLSKPAVMLCFDGFEGYPVSTQPEFYEVDGNMPNAPILVSMPVGNFLATRRKNVYGPDTGKGVVRDPANGAILGTTCLIKYSTI